MVYAVQVLSSAYSPILGYSICMVFSQRLMIIFLVQQRKIFDIDHNKQQSERRLFGFCSFFVVDGRSLKLRGQQMPNFLDRQRTTSITRFDFDPGSLSIPMT